MTDHEVEVVYLSYCCPFVSCSDAQARDRGFANVEDAVEHIHLRHRRKAAPHINRWPHSVLHYDPRVGPIR